MAFPVKAFLREQHWEEGLWEETEVVLSLHLEVEKAGWCLAQRLDPDMYKHGSDCPFSAVLFWLHLCLL